MYWDRNRAVFRGWFCRKRGGLGADFYGGDGNPGKWEIFWEMANHGGSDRADVLSSEPEDIAPPNAVDMTLPKLFAGWPGF